MTPLSRSTLCLVAALLALPLAPDARQPAPTPEQRTAREMEAIRAQPPRLLAFLQQMPKGGDLHNHLVGSVYAESMIGYAAANGQCVDRASAHVLAGPCDPCEGSSPKPGARCAYQDPGLYNSLVDAWSMRNWRPERVSGHDHFFATFGKFSPATIGHVGDILAEVASRSARDRLQYLELMHTADGGQAGTLAATVPWDDDFATLRNRLLPGIKTAVASSRKQLDDDEAKMRAVLGCGTAQADPGCGVTVRYLYQVLRGLPREQVFAQILFGYEIASTDPRVVGVNLVMPEDWAVPMRDFRLHMRMLEFMHGAYPRVHLTLHAGELAMGLVPPEGLRFHIRESIERAHADRIGHGVSIMSETDPAGLLGEMARRRILVEINLTSNHVILGVSGRDHPLSIYMKAGVAVALSTDDAGVARSDMTHEYLRAVLDQGLSYTDLKRMSRSSLEHSFLPGASLWAATTPFALTRACAADQPDAARPSAPCAAVLDASEKARVQWDHERAIALFERAR